MSETPESILSPFSKQAAQFTWLIVDVFFLFLLLLSFTFYKDLSEEPAHQFFRLYFVFCLGHFILSGLHLLSYHRHDDAQRIAKQNDPASLYKQFPAWRSYGLYLFKVLWFVAFLYIAVHRGLIPPLF
ncbi:hypothetical protein [Petrachloros mirabilis]